jgi:hypothetical protein
MLVEIAPGQPDTRKEIRLKLAEICAAMDDEIEEAAADFAEFLISQRADHCRAVSNGLSSPVPRTTDRPL